ncbi:MAG: hypothetical protein PHF00_04600 [Elusimicrobia bacterium]|nr:hypothetical protein [Elusimicrobiota bacterium]
MKVRAILAAAVFLGWGADPAAGLAVEPQQTDELHEEVTELKDAVTGSATDSDVHELAQNLFGRVPGTQIVVAPNLRGWDFPRGIKGQRASVDQLLKSADNRLAFYNGDIPKPLEQAMNYARGMKRDGKVNFDPSLKDNQMGAYIYLVQQKLQLGRIALNRAISYLAAKIGEGLAFSTFIHEAAHADNRANLSVERTIETEIPAFRTQRQWLGIEDPYAEKVCYLRQVMINEQRERPNPDTAMALTYLNHLAEVEDADNDQKIRRMVEKLGYRDGQSSRYGSEVSP